jgi:predicted ATP-dependent endonuclease of OLD family
MYLSKLVVINFRSCNCLEIDFLTDDPNIYIGKNDCGKTSLLKAIGLLLEDRPQFNFVKETASKKDFSNSPISKEDFDLKLNELALPSLPYDQFQTVIIGKLALEAADTADENINQFSNHLAWTVENNQDAIWMARVFNTRENSIKTYLNTPDQLLIGKLASFYQLGVRELGNKRKEYIISDEDIDNVNRVGRYSKLEIVRALYRKTGTTATWVEYKFEPAFFPQFSYLDWNMSFEEITKTATQVMATIIDAYITPVKTNAIQQASEAETQINSKLSEMKEAIAEIAPITGLKTKVQFDVKEKITDIFVTKESSDGDIHMDLQGDGLKRQIWFALIKASTLAGAPVQHKRFLWAFDEPETHLYPAAQRKLFDIIKSVTYQSVQSFISTHSTVFIDKSNLKAIRCIHQTGNCYTDHYSCSNIDDIFLSLDIRNSDFLFFDKFLVIEGETEQHLIPRLYEIHSGSSLKEDNIQLIKLKGGSNWHQQKQSLESVMTGFKKSLNDIVYLFDNDQKFLIGEGAIEATMFFVGKQDIEDSLENELWIWMVNKKTEGKIALTNEDIQNIKDAIHHNAKVRSDEKFLVRLNQMVRHRLAELEDESVTYDLLPSKGIDLAEAILEYLSEKGTIPKVIIDCFNKLKNSTEVEVMEQEEVAQSEVLS